MKPKLWQIMEWMDTWVDIAKQAFYPYPEGEMKCLRAKEAK